MKIRFSIDARMAEQAGEAAQAMGKSLNQAVRDHLEHLASRAQLETEIAAYLRSTARSAGRIGRWTFNRDKLQRSE